MSDKTPDQTPTKLTESEIAASLEGLDTWSEVGGTIQRTYEFPDFIAAMAFVNKVADAAEQQQHHPDILVRYSKVTLTLSTHDAGGITSKDFDLARFCDSIA